MALPWRLDFHALFWITTVAGVVSLLGVLLFVPEGYEKHLAANDIGPTLDQIRGWFERQLV